MSRCESKEDGAGVLAKDACPATCSNCPSACADDATWFYDGDEDKNCAKVAEKLSRCDSKEDENGALAKDACPVTCSNCPDDDAEEEDDEEEDEPEETCTDSTSWYYKSAAVSHPTPPNDPVPRFLPGSLRSETRQTK